MKQSFLNLLISLTLVASLMACEREVPSPLYNAEKNEVTADFVINIAASDNAETKMTATNVQKANNFLGITDATIFAYATGHGFVTPADYNATTPAESNFKAEFPLGAIVSSSEINGSINKDKSSRRVLQLSIPLETDAVLLYGRAVNDNPGGATGKLKYYNVSANPSETYFHAQRRIGEESDVALYDATARLMIFVVNRIGLTALDGVDSYTWTDPKDATHQKTYTNLPAISCPELCLQYRINNGLYGHPGSGETVKTMTPLEVIIGRVVSNITHINDGEYRAGSSSAIKALMIQIYNAINPVANADPTSPAEANAVRLATAVIRRMNEYYDQNWNYKDVLGDGGIKDVITSNNLIDFDWDDATKGFKNVENLNNYPGSFHIPEGAAQLTFNSSTNRFEYMHPNKPLVNLSLNEFEPRKYLYPVELLYYVNSPLRVTSNDGIQIADYPNGVDNWNLAPTAEGSKWAINGWNEGKVVSSTRAVAVKHNVAYGVAMLETKVEWGAATLKDNRAAMTQNAESDEEIPVADMDIVLTGVLVGGQNPRMNWQFIRKDATGTEAEGKYILFDGVVYDDVMASGVIPTTDTPNYTLVFDNYNSDLADDAQSDTYVALEFKNNGDPFWGKHNLIATGSKFYLVAKLENNDANKTAIANAWPANSQIPPINETTGVSKQVPRIFIQDFMTKATFKIGENSLKNAYYTMPDLRSTQMSLGLSVDLQWKNGYSYELEL